MKRVIIFLTILILPMLMHSQEVVLKTTLDNSLQETSGLIKLNQKLITHNDSGSSPELYELDSITGRVTRTVKIDNATNKDWEDICCDSTYIYIGDFGNNFGSRKDLKIYRIPIADYSSTDNKTVTAETINFSYVEQTDFSSHLFATNFDAEALIAYNDSLYIFTKNWKNKRTDIYAVPKLPGNYQIKRIGNINAQGLVTGADYNPISSTIILTGYGVSTNFTIEIRNFDFTNLSEAIINRYEITPPKNTSRQIEGIACVGKNRYFLTSEEHMGEPPALIELKSSTSSSTEITEKESTLIYPNPSSNFLQIKYRDFASAKIYDCKGVLCKQSSDKEIYIGDLESGFYIIRIKSLTNNNFISKKIIKE